MKILVITDSGCEEACAEEITRWMECTPSTEMNVVSLDGSLDDAQLLGYNLKTARRVLIEMTEPLEDLSELPNREIQIFPAETTFKVEGDVLHMKINGVSKDKTMTQELIEAVAGCIKDRKVSLENPDVIVYTVKTPEKTYIGRDVMGRSLSRRDWRIMLSRRSLKSTVAAAAAIYAGVTKKDKILDPFGDDGTLSIETALLLSGISPLRFNRNVPKSKDREDDIEKITVFCENLKEMKAVRTNSKLAGVEKFLHSTKVPIDWMSAKIDEVDKILTYPLTSGKALPLKRAQKILDEFFQQASVVLKKKGTVTCITGKPEEVLSIAEKHKFSKSDTKDVLMGMQRMTILTMKK